MRRNQPAPQIQPPPEKEKTYFDRYNVFCLHDLNNLTEDTYREPPVHVAPESDTSAEPSASAYLQPPETRQSSPSPVSEAATPAVSGTDPSTTGYRPPPLASAYLQPPTPPQSLSPGPISLAENPAVSSLASSTPSVPPPPSLALASNWRRYNADVPIVPSNAGNTERRASDGLQRPMSFQALFEKDPHPYARERVTIASLQRDSSIKAGLDLYAGIARYPERLIRPVFKDEVPDGMDAVWDVLRTLFDEADKNFCNAVLAGFTDMSSRHITRLVISKVGRNSKFQALYNAVNQTPAAAYLTEHLLPHVPEAFGKDINYPTPSAAGSSPSTVDRWDFLMSTVKLNPLIKIFRNEVWEYVKYRTYALIASLKHDVTWVVTRHETLGKRVLVGEAEGHYNVYPPSRRRRSATDIIDLISGKKARNGIRGLLLSPTTYYMACSIVGNLGRSNIGRALVAVGTQIEQVEVPDSVIPLAATLVEQELKVVAACENEVDGRSGPFQDCLSYSETARTQFRGILTVWTQMYLNRNTDKDVDAMLEFLRKEEDLKGATNAYKSAQAIQLAPAPEEPVVLLPSTLLRPPPPAYAAEGI